MDDTGFQMLVKPIIQLYTVLVSTILTDLKSLGYNTNQMYIESLLKEFDVKGIQLEFTV